MDAPGRKLGQGRGAEIYEWDDGRVLRLWRDPGNARLAEWEMTATRAAAAAGLPVPCAHEALTVDGRPALVMDRLSGPDLLEALGRRPWQIPSVGAQLGSLHARLNSTPAPPGLPDVRARLARFIEAAADAPPRPAARALDLLEAASPASTLYHGDFHPANVMLDDGRLVVIDWSNAAQGCPEADHARTLVLLHAGELPRDSALPVRMMAGAGRRLIAWAYRRAYRRQQPLDPTTLDRWLYIQTAARFGEGVVSEYPLLLRELERLERRPALQG
jgi:aminoglycoside phosphotransferase (APT) family kinase protein